MAGDAMDWQDDEIQLTATTNTDGSTEPARVPGLTLLAHPDVRRIGERLVLPFLAFGRSVRLSRLEPGFRQPGDGSGADAEERPLAERSLSRQPIRLRGGEEAGSVTLDVRDTRTPVTADGFVVDGWLSLDAASLERGVVLALGRRIVLLLHHVMVPFVEGGPRFGLVGESTALLRLCREIERLATLDVPVLLRGENGTSKELVARALHDAGPRRAGPFMALNMAKLSPSLAAATLFGAAPGAYAGAAVEKKGVLQSVRGGTLFLDEIGSTPIEVQAMLLRALESREVVPVGSGEAVDVDVRVVAATDAHLEEAVADGRFRLPLYHRLAGDVLELPPLRARRDDIGRLLRYFLGMELVALGAEDADLVPPSAEIVARLARYDWPGNDRELRSVARRLAIGGADGGAPSLEAVLATVSVPSPHVLGETEAQAPMPPKSAPPKSAPPKSAPPQPKPSATPRCQRPSGNPRG